MLACTQTPCAAPNGREAQTGHDARTSAMRVAAWLLPALRWGRAVAERRRQRRALAALDDRLLADIGLSRSEQRSEARKPCWR